MDVTTMFLKVYLKFENTSTFSFTTFVGISVSWAAFEASNYFISLETSSNVKWEKLKSFWLLSFFLLLIY